MRRRPKPKKRGLFDRGRELFTVGVGPLSFDVEMARSHGWSDKEIERLWDRLEHAYQRASRRMNRRHGRTAICPRCECYTYPNAPKPHRCHLCNEDARGVRNL